MTAAKTPPMKGRLAPKKGIHGRMPTKRTINLVLVDENKISVGKAVPGILIILVLAALFSKFLVADRLAAVSEAQARVARLQQNLDESMALLDTFGDVEETYAHYTLAGMTEQELSLVDRPQVMALVGSIIDEGAVKFDAKDLSRRVARMDALLRGVISGELSREAYAEQLAADKLTLPRPEITVQSWSLVENVLTVELTGITLERLNQLARELEQDPIVDTCTLTTANMNLRYDYETDVQARFIVYLTQPSEEEVTAP